MIENERQLQAKAAEDGRACIITALIPNGRHQLFAMKRAPTRPLFPNCWDFPGGRVESGETLTQALAREIYEETGWLLLRILQPIHTFDWELDGRPMREFCYLVEVEGDLERPQLETEKFSASRWVGRHELELLKENRDATDLVIYTHTLVKKTLAYLDANSVNGRSDG